MHEAKLTVPLDDAVQVSAFNNRTVPDVPELVRYECELIGDFIDSYGMAEHSDGDYVRYDQVAKVIHGWTTKLFDQVITIEGLRNRVKAAETKLAEYEKQEPVAWQHAITYPDGVKYIGVLSKTPKPQARPLYAAPAPKSA